MAGEKLIRRALQAAREAAKPLPMDEASRMARAEALNFNPTTFYHATSQEFPAFDMRRAGEGATIGKGERAAFLVNRPAVADSYLGGQYVNRENAAASGFSTADMGGNIGRYYTPGSQVMPLRVRDLDQFTDWDFGGGFYTPKEMAEVLRDAKKEGAPGAIIRNVRDPGFNTANNPVGNPRLPSAVLAVRDPSFIRSVFARFDPKKITSKDLLAGGAGVGAVGAAMEAGDMARDGYAGGGVSEKALKVVRQLNPLGLFSKATEAAANLPQAKGTGEQMRKMLIDSKGVKPEELRWTGFDDWIKGKKSVTRDEMVEFLKKNEVQVGEEVLGKVTKGVPYPQEAVKIEQEIMDRYRDELARLNSIAIDYYQPINARRKAQMEYEKLTDKRNSEIDAAIPNREALIETSRDKRVPTKFDKYTLPGGENYREVLLTRPPMRNAADTYEETVKGLQREIAALEDANPNWTPELERRRQALFTQLDDANRSYIAAGKPEKSESYLSSHWNEPNVLAHLRMKERVDPQGRRVLHLEELQSDWAQEGRKTGFDTPEKAQKIAAMREEERKLQARYNDLRLQRLEIQPKSYFVGEPLEYPEGYSHELAARLSREMRETQNEIDAIRRNMPGPGVPSAPFVESTPGWTNLALKRAMIEAARGNYDAIAWTPGREQAKRYDLSQHVREIEYIPNGDGTYRLGVTSMQGEGVPLPNAARMTLEDIERSVGKEIAEKIKSGEGRQYRGHEGRTLEGLDLQVGGQGMVGYYDKILPTQISKVLKDIGETPQFGNVSIPVERQSSKQFIPSGPDLQNAPQSYELPSFNITPEMREKINQGLPLFTMMPAAVGLGAAQMQERANPAAPVEGATPAAESQTTEPREGFDKGGVIAKALRTVRQMMEKSQNLPPEQRMMVVHKTRLPALEQYERLGGLPVPSTAIVKTGEPLTKFGDVTLVGNPEILAKPSERNPIFASDVYSPRMPDIQGNKKQFFEVYNKYGEPTQRPATLGSLVRNMRGNIRGGENFSATEGAVRAQITPQFRSVAELDAARGRLSQAAYDEALAAIRGRGDELFARIGELSRNPRGMDFYGDMEGAAGIMRQYGNQSANPLAAYMTKRYNVGNDEMTDVIRYIKNLRDMPAPYFEGKPQRAVPFTDFSGALIPEGPTARQTADLLNRQGVKNIEFYSPKQDLGGGEAQQALSDALIDRFPGQQFAEGGEVRREFQGGGRTEMTPEEYNRALEMAKDVLRQQLRTQIDAANGGFDPAVPIDWQLSRPKITDRVPPQRVVARSVAPQRVVARSVAPMAYAPVAPAAPAGAAPAGAAIMAYAPVAPAAEAPAAPVAARQQGPVERAMAVVRSVPQAAYEAVSSPVATAQNIAREIFSGNNYQSTGEPIMSDGRINWGDPESAADFFRADKALQEMRPYREDRASGGRLLEDEYPTQYLPDVGRQVMADGGEIQDKDYFSQLYESKKLFDRPLPSLSYNTDREGISVEPARENLFQKHYEEMKESKRPYVSGKTTMPFLGGNLSFQGSYMPERDVPKKSFGAELEYKFADGGRAIDVARQVMADGGDTMAGFMPPTAAEMPAAVRRDDAYLDALIEASRPRPQSDADIQTYQRQMRERADMPENIRSMTHAPSKPLRPVEIEGGFTGKRQLGEVPYDVAGPLSGMAQTAYSLKTLPFYFTPAMPLAAASDVVEAGIDTKNALQKGDYLSAALSGGLGVGLGMLPFHKQIGSAVGSAVNTARDVLGRVPAPVAAGAAGAAAMTPTEAEAGPAGTIVRAAKKAAAPAQTFRGSDLIAKDPNAAAVILSKRDPAGAVDFGQAINRAEYTFTPKGDLQPWKEFDPVQAVRERGVITGLLGDRSAAGSVVHDINGVRLTEPVNRSGGGEFQRSTEGPEVWASRPGAVRNMYTRINKGMEKQGISRDVPVFASHVLMGLPGIDSTQKMAKGILRQIEPTRDKIDLKAAAAFDEAIRKKYPKWPGILNPDEAEKFLSTKEVGKRTSTILQRLDTAGAQKGGLPNLGATRFAMMEPRLVSADQGATGFAISRLDPRGITNVAAHDTYPRGMLGPTQSAADYMGGTRYQVPLSVMFPDWWKTVKPTYVDKKSGMTKKTTPTMIQQSVLTQVPLQRASQEWLDNLMAYMEANPKKWGYRHGGGVSHRAMMIAKELGSSPRETVTS